MKNVMHGKKKIIKMISFVLIVIISVALSYIPKHNENKSGTTWDDIYVNAGLRDGSKEDKSPFSVHFIDVGQGDCTLIKSGDFSMLIDAGEQGNEEKILDYLKTQNIKEITYLVATHPHSDHIGGMKGVISNTKVKNIIMPKLTISNTPTTKQYEEFIKSVKNSNANVKLVEQPYTFKHKDINIDVLSPCNQSNNLNNMSVVIKLTYKNKSFLFMGDAEKEVENELINNGMKVQADVLKAGHHGSSSSSIPKFIEAVNPIYVVMSCGKNNSFGHPNEETLNTLKQNNVKFNRTDKDGTIVVDYNDNQLIISTEKGEKSGKVLS